MHPTPAFAVLISRSCEVAYMITGKSPQLLVFFEAEHWSRWFLSAY